MEKGFDPRVCAHRGFRAVAPENTMLAARKAYEIGAAWWEMDVAASTDEVLFVMHDETLCRTTNAEKVFPNRGPWSIYDFSSAELRSLDAGSWYREKDPHGQIAAGAVTERDLATFVGLKLPTLEEALSFTAEKNWHIDIEIKDATGKKCDPWIVERTVDMVRRFKLVERAHISSFNHAYLRRVRAYEPRLDTGALIEGKLPDNCVEYLKALDVSAINPDFKLLNEKLVKEIRAAGFDVLPWTVNEKADIKRLLDWGVTGVIGDFPNRVIDVLNSK
jgi:glycerophosphoryl diester phosphodiesterase